ncbi:MAG: hypothetical protein D6830_07900 [Ignavibacteria bacterium]|nr:MAG: hypothetical protein D6830_07900 [Ignavibacteria bacterium]
MSKEITNNKVLIILLSLASVGIWGAILYQIDWGFRFGSDIESISMPDKKLLTLSPDSINASYNKNFFGKSVRIRNPFRPLMLSTVSKKIRPIMSKPVSEVNPKPTPHIRYIGFVSDKKGRLAILELDDGTTRFCNEGDSIGRIRIAHIKSDQISINLEGKLLEIPLQK